MMVRSFTSKTLFLITTVIAFLCSIYTSHAGKAPNILLILSDDQGYADTSFSFGITHGGSDEGAPIPTPNLDKLAKNGIIFSNHYTHCMCAFTRSAMLTSRFAYHLGNPFPSGLDPRMGGDLPSGYVTLAHELKKRGYTNYLIGKYGLDWHGRYWDFEKEQWFPSLNSNNVAKNGLGPMARGFDEFYGTYGSALNHYNKKFNGVIDWHKFNSTHYLDSPNQFYTEPNTHTTDIFVRETINVITNHKNNDNNDDPWFIYLAFTAPHSPLLIDEEKYLNPKDYPYCASKTNRRRGLYCGLVAGLDEGIGRITQALDKMDLLERDTIIIFSSDNGGMAFLGGYNYPYAGGKFGAFQGADITPAFIYAPQVFKQTSGNVFNGMMHIVDWAPTLISLVDQEVNDLSISQVKQRALADAKSGLKRNNLSSHEMGDIDGRDYSYVLKTFTNGNSDDNNVIYDSIIRDELLLEMNGWNNVTAYISGDYKLTYGFANVDMVLTEPDDECAINSKIRENRGQCLPDYLGRFIEIVFGIEYYAYEYLIIGWLGKFQDDVIKRGVSYTVPVHRHPLGMPDVNYYYNQYANSDKWNENEFIDPNKNNPNLRPIWIPSVNWNDSYETGKIRLFNLKNDPGEQINIAMQNKDIVDKMIEKIAQDAKKYSNNVNSLCFAFHVQIMYLEDKFKNFMKIVGTIGVLINVLLGYMICKCCGCCKRSNSKDKTD